jgi:hypothetical protein
LGKRKTNPIKYLEPRKGLRIFNVLNKEIIKVMTREIKAIPVSGEDVNGMTWYSINKNGRPTGDQIRAFNRTEAVDIWNKLIMP